MIVMSNLDFFIIVLPSFIPDQDGGSTRTVGLEPCCPDRERIKAARPWSSQPRSTFGCTMVIWVVKFPKKESTYSKKKLYIV